MDVDIKEIVDESGLAIPRYDVSIVYHNIENIMKVIKKPGSAKEMLKQLRLLRTSLIELRDSAIYIKSKTEQTRRWYNITG